MEATMNSTKTHQEEVLFEFFKIEEHTTDAWPRAICIQCGALVRRFLGSTSAMKFHLSRKHRQLFQNYLSLVLDGKKESFKEHDNLKGR